jgi:hypothetical protein
MHLHRARKGTGITFARKNSELGRIWSYRRSLRVPSVIKRVTKGARAGAALEHVWAMPL